MTLSNHSCGGRHKEKENGLFFFMKFLPARDNALISINWIFEIVVCNTKDIEFYASRWIKLCTE